MALIQSDAKGKKVALTIELDRKTNATLKKYTRFAAADVNKVIVGALQRLFEQDEDFGPWLREKDQKAKDREDRRAKKDETAIAAGAR
jgi:hypothetical protein